MAVELSEKHTLLHLTELVNMGTPEAIDTLECILNERLSPTVMLTAVGEFDGGKFVKIMSV